MQLYDIVKNYAHNSGNSFQIHLKVKPHVLSKSEYFAALAQNRLTDFNVTKYTILTESWGRSQ